ncbi:MAG: TraB/GumN family protein [Vicinamibacterales bacterium]
MKKIALALALVLLAPIQAIPQTRSFLWKATKGPGAVYLVGSLHLLTKDYYPLAPALDAAFKDADLLVEEADLGEMLSPQSQLAVVTRGMLPANQSLDQLVSPATFALVTKRVAALGAPIEPLKRFKPWMIALTVLGLEWQKAGFEPELGLDKHFYDRARAEGKMVQGLETTDFQISLFDSMTRAQQDRLLAESLEASQTEMASVRQLADAWRGGDAATVERIVLGDLSDDRELYQSLVVNRNRSWLPKIEALFARRGRAFVVIGAAHLIGPDGLLAVLKAKGYAVEQM